MCSALYKRHWSTARITLTPKTLEIYDKTQQSNCRKARPLKHLSTLFHYGARQKTALKHRYKRSISNIKYCSCGHDIVILKTIPTWNFTALNRHGEMRTILAQLLLKGYCQRLTITSI